jgi:hypothetical protein
MTQNLSILAAIGFVAPALAVAGLALAAIPVIIHILNRRRYKVHRWAAMTYLMEALRKNRRRLQFEHWLLMTIRCCALILAGVALARPLGCSNSATGRLLGSATRLNVFVIDNTASMAYQRLSGQSRTNFDRAKALTGEILKDLSTAHDAVSIVPTAGEMPAIARAATYDLDAARQAAADLPQQFTGGDLSSALRQSLEVARTAGSFPSRRLYILTDATKPAWQDPRVAQALRQLGPDLAATFDVVHIDVAPDRMPNASVSDLHVLGNVVTTGMPSDFAAKPRAFGGRSASMVWQVGSQVAAASGTISLTPDTPEQVLPQVSFKADEPVAITARLEPSDQLPEDDSASLTVEVRKRVSVLIASGEPGRTPLESPGATLQLALSPAAGADAADATRAPARVERISDTELSSKPLAQFDAVILAGASRLAESDARQLRIYVEQGGTLLVFMGEGMAPDNVNQLLGSRGLLPGKITSLATTPENANAFRFDFRPDAALHPLLRVFRGEQQSGLATARIWTYARTDIDPKLNVQRVLDFATGDASRGNDPAITLHNVGRGRVVFFATSADTRWTTLPGKPAFVALINEIVLGTVADQSAWMNIPAGQRLQIPRRVAGAGAPTLSDSQGKPLTLDPAPANQSDLAYISEVLVRPGQYRLKFDSKNIPISVQFPASESDLTHLSPAAIKTALGEMNLQQTHDEVPAATLSAAQRADFSWPVLLAVLGLLGLESFLAMWFRQ